MPVLFNRSKEDTVPTLVLIGQQETAGPEPALLRGGYRPRRLQSKQLYLLQGLPGVGPESAVRLLRYFGSAGRVMNALPAELTEVVGVGKTTAAKIREVLD